MADINRLSQIMKADWDRRVAHDYRFWMSDGYRDDQAMWASGARDFKILAGDISNTQEQTFLEIGCGVGRLLKPASEHFGKVIGVDVSEKAIAKAGELLGSPKNLQLIVGNGIDLHQIPSASVDVAVSFAALTSMPTDVIAQYLREIQRVLKPGGLMRLQVYVGQAIVVSKTDTLHLRCYREADLAKAFEAAGFKLTALTDLVLPIQVSFADIGIVAKIASLTKLPVEPVSVEVISKTLLPQGESESDDQGLDLEYWTTVNYAKELADQGQFAQAEAALNYALTHCQASSIDARDLLDRIVSKIERQEVAPARDQGVLNFGSNAIFEKNLRALQDRFPEIHAQILAYELKPDERLTIKSTADGPVIMFDGQAIDHAEKPKSAADAWVKRQISEKRFEKTKHIAVYGFGSGYHIESLLGLGTREVSVIEPHMNLFCAALRIRDLTLTILRLRGLSIGENESLSFLDPETELAVRPQTQVFSQDYCKKVKAQFYGTRGFSTLHPKIAVLGPIQGGTLPMLEYCTRAMLLQRQRVRDLDMSGYAAAYHLNEKFLQDKTRQAIMHGNFIELMSQMVLEALSEKPADILVVMAQAPISGRVLAELRSRGVITVLWFVEDYLRFSYWQSMAQFYDFVFTIQKGKCIEAIKAAGAGEVHYLPTACDPWVHKPLSLSEEERNRWGSPISFVGAGYHNRQQMFAAMANMPFKIWGTEWPGCRPFDRLVQEAGRRLSPEEYIKIFNATDINLNLHSSTERDGVDPFGDFVNPRTFELAASGAFQLVDERSLLPECFEAGKEIITFKNTADMKDKIAYYLDRPEERRAISEAGRARVLRDHTYEARIKSMLSIVYSSKFETLKSRADASPWSKVLERAKPHTELHQRAEAAFQRGEDPNLDGLVADIVTGQGKLTETEQKLLFLFHVRKQIIRMKTEEMGMNNPK